MGNEEEETQYNDTFIKKIKNTQTTITTFVAFYLNIVKCYHTISLINQN